MHRLLLISSTVCALATAVMAQSPAQQPAQSRAPQGVTVGKWEGHTRHDFLIDGHKSWLILPAQPAAGKPWIWRTEFFGHEPQADLALVAKGWHVGYTDVTNHYGSPPSMARMDAFYNHVRARYQLNVKVTLEGFSRGGLFALNWAIRHPLQTASLYLDAPVCDILSWPGGFGLGKRSQADWERCLGLHGLADDRAALLSIVSPVHQLQRLAAAKVPILSVVGDADRVVPYYENTAILAARYLAFGGPMEIIIKPGVDHHPHSLKDPAPIVEFLVKHLPK